MKRYIENGLSRLVAAGLILLMATIGTATVFHSCSNENNPVDSTVDRQVKRSALLDGVSELNYCLDNGVCYTGLIYTSQSTIGLDKILLTYNDRKLDEFTYTLADQGYTFALNRSRYEVTHSTTGRDVSQVFVAFVGPGDESGLNLALVRYAVIRGVSETIQLEKMYVDADGVTVWTESYEPKIRIYQNDVAQAPALDPPDGSAQIDFKEWLKCTAESSAIGCAAMAGACLLYPNDDYSECVESGCREALFAAAAHCTAAQIFGE